MLASVDRQPGSSGEAGLVRAIGLFGLTAAIVNVTVGGGIYRLPAAAALLRMAVSISTP